MYIRLAALSIFALASCAAPNEHAMRAQGEEPSDAGGAHGMSMSLVVERRSANARPSTISLEEWKQVVEQYADLRLRSEPYVAVNPKTGERIQMPAGQADAEIQVQGRWVPFLRFSRGALTTRYRREFDDPTDPIRARIALVARQLGAVIGTDAGDEVLSW